MARVSKTLTAGFSGGLTDADEDGFLDTQVSIKFGGGVTQDGIGFQVFPAVSALLYASNGDIVNDGKRVIKDIKDVVTFSGSDSGSVGHPVTSLGPYTLLGDAFSPEGKTISPSLSLDSEKYRLKASKEMYGAYSVEYDTSYLQCYWKHNGERHGDLWYKGIVLAMYKGSVAVLESNDGNDDSDSFEKTEIYRVTSKYVVDSEGGWEYPPEWPESSSYPGYSGDESPDTGSYQVLERVHFIGYVNVRGTQTYDQFYIHIEQPFIGHSNYDPQYLLTLNRDAPDGFEDAYSGVNFDTITSDMRARYSNLQVL